MIPLYRIDQQRCILLDSGLVEQREALDALLQEHGLVCVGIIGSHAHMDHAGNHRFFQRTYGATVAMSLGEAGILASQLGMELSLYNLSPRQIAKASYLEGMACTADVIILPTDQQVTLHGVTFDVFHTPGHSAHHIAVRTPDDVAYLGDAIMTGRTLFRSKFPYAFSVAACFDSLRLLRSLEAETYIAAHFGIYPEILSHVDMELAFLQRRMNEILELVEGDSTVECVAKRIGEVYGIQPKDITDMAYFERATRAYLQYLFDLGLLEVVLVDGLLRYCRTGAPLPERNDISRGTPPPG
ncbi:MAG: hydrolase [Evtepia sp.]|nr:hydrolase [Evtepia sp.]